MLRKILRMFLKLFLCLLGLVALYFLCAWLFQYIKVNRDFQQPEKGVEIFIRTNGAHCDVIVPARTPVKDWFSQLPPSDFDLVDTTFGFAVFGWGDKAFYLRTPRWSDLKLSIAFRALFWMSTTAMHVGWSKYAPEENKNCRKIVITEEAYEKLVQYIQTGFSRDGKGNFQLIDHKGYTAYDKFYEGTGTYSLFNTCNVWTGNALAAAGVKVGWWTPFEWGVMNSAGK